MLGLELLCILHQYFHLLSEKVIVGTQLITLGAKVADNRAHIVIGELRAEFPLSL